jgi:hypothetical protein
MQLVPISIDVVRRWTANSALQTELTPVEKEDMKTMTHTAMRATAAIGTVVALIATVGAPFKWSMILPWFDF